MSVSTKTVSGQIRTFNVNEKKPRQYVVLSNLTFKEARELFKPQLYSWQTGKGQQRSINDGNLKKLMTSMSCGEYVPTIWHAGTTENQRNNFVISGDQFTYTLNDGDFFPLINAWHRESAIETLYKRAIDGKKTEYIELIEKQPVDVILLLDGHLQDDFIALQKSKPVDSSHMLMMTAARTPKKRDILCLAIEAGKILARDKNSPFFNQIRFDTGSVAPIPIKSICSTGSSDIGASLVGLATVVNDAKRDAGWAAGVICDCYQALDVEAPYILGRTSTNEGDNWVKKLLTPPPNGTKGSASMLVGISTVMAYRLVSLDKDCLDSEETKCLIDACESTLNEVVDKNFSVQMKRSLLGRFTEKLMSDFDEPMHEGIPVELIKLLSASTFSVTPLAKEGKKRGRPAKNKVENEEGSGVEDGVEVAA